MMFLPTDDDVACPTVYGAWRVSVDDENERKRHVVQSKNDAARASTMRPSTGASVESML